MKRILLLIVSAIAGTGILFSSEPDRSMESIVDKAAEVLAGQSKSIVHPGTMWYLYDYTGNPEFLKTAAELTDRLKAEQLSTSGHVQLAMIGPGLINGYRMTGKETYRKELIDAGEILSDRLEEDMVALELLTVSSAVTGKPEHFRLAGSLADKMMPEHGPVSSSELAYRIYTYTMMYRQCGEREYLEYASEIAGLLLKHPFNPAAPEDAESAAVMASALVELSSFLDGGTGQACLDLAGKLIRTLRSSRYMQPGHRKHSPLAGYYYMESLLRYRRLLDGKPAADLMTLSSENEDRALWVSHLEHFSRPLLENMSRNTLKAHMPVESTHKDIASRYYVTHLEAFGRLATGIGPWLELGPDETPEGRLRARYIDLMLACLRNGMDPDSPDHLNFTGDRQPLVDAAFLCHGLLRARTSLLDKVDEVTMQRLVANLRSTRSIRPNESNWLLFSAMVECFLKETTGEWNFEPVRYALDRHASWYKGDGMYGDGPEFHMDYYNSYVIQPMLVQVLEIVAKYDGSYVSFRDRQRTRYGRYAAILEKMVSPEATIPAVGRSLPYRCGALQALSDAAYLHLLPHYMTPQQVRCAMTAVIDRQMNLPGTYDRNGWLTVGFAGHQPNIAETYISTGSLYLCSSAFIALGLDTDDPFWSAPYEDWTQKKVWKGEDLPGDHALWE